jgi:hypothetical protein
MNKTLKMNYLARDFSSIKNELKDYAKRYYSNDLADLSEASINSFMIESAAYIGDILSYYLDYQTNETFLATAIERKNVLNLAKSLGYKQRDTSSTTGKVAMYLLIPDNGNNEPDYKRSPVIKKGTELRSVNGNLYTTIEDIKIDETVVGTNYVVARTNEVGNPTYYAVKVYVPIISGKLSITNIDIGSFVKFNKVYLDDPRIAEVVSVVDSEGNVYYEVPNLAQNIVYKSIYNSESEPKYILKPISAQRRFVFDYDTSLPYLLFGGKQYRPDDDLTVDPVAEPTKFALNKYNNDYLQDEFFEPNKLLNGDSYGVGPENTTITVVYRANLTSNNNSSIGDITTVSNIQYSFDDPFITDSVSSTIISSIQVVNEEDIVGQNNEIEIEEIKDLAGNIYNAQNRAVTAKDYETLCYMMPQKYGAVKRVKAERDPTSLKNNINLYTVCIDQFGSLKKANTQIKENLKSWLSNYKIITDTVDILDAKIINLGINFTILVDPNADKIETLDKVQAQLQYVFSSKAQVGESFNILDIYREIRKIKDVLDIKDVKIRNITDIGYSSIPFNIQQNLTSDGNMIKIPRNAIYEIKNPKTDIIGNAL